jgi:hypothetical protein
VGLKRDSTCRATATMAMSDTHNDITGRQARPETAWTCLARPDWLRTSCWLPRRIEGLSKHLDTVFLHDSFLPPSAAVGGGRSLLETPRVPGTQGLSSPCVPDTESGAPGELLTAPGLSWD